LQQPDADHHNYQDVQNRFDTGGHGNELVDQVQRHPDYNQHNDKIYQRHFLAPSSGKEQFVAHCSGGEYACVEGHMSAGLARGGSRLGAVCGFQQATGARQMTECGQIG
jgi:hypothetical protein